MAEQTGIQWCDATFNPWVGCEKVSPGCAHCYAEKLVTGRMGRNGTWGVDGTRQRTSPSNWKKPLRWARLAREGRLPDGTENLDGHRPRIFCASLADVFEDRAELDPWRNALFALIDDTPELDWLLLTKRPEIARDWLLDWYLRFYDGCYLENVWLGVSIENARHTYRADILREIPAAVRFISAEPLLGSLFPPRCEKGIRTWKRESDGLDPFKQCVLAEGHRGAHPLDLRVAGDAARPLDLSGIDWIIVGGESGPGARPFHLEHAREIIHACLEIRTRGGTLERARQDPPKVFVKQLGAKPRYLDYTEEIGRGIEKPLRLRDRKGGDWSEWLADLRIREFPRSAA